MDNYRPEGGIVYTLRLHNDCETVIGRIKYALDKATFPFYGCVFKGEPWPKEINALHRDLIEKSLRLIWRGDGYTTDGFDNETDEFLDAIGLPKRERGSLIRKVADSEGRVCKYCGFRGRNRRCRCDHDFGFYIYPDGSEVCSDCENGIECGAGPCEWRGENHDT